MFECSENDMQIFDLVLMTQSFLRWSFPPGTFREYNLYELLKVFQVWSFSSEI